MCGWGDVSGRGGGRIEVTIIRRIESNLNVF